MFVEVQLRTFLQNVWATAVETTDFFRGTSMKTKGSTDDWGEFFVVVSGLYAVLEKEPEPERLKEKGLVGAMEVLTGASKSKGIFDRLSVYASTGVLDVVNFPKNTFYIIINVDAREKKVSCRAFGKESYSEAVDIYEKMEHEGSGSSVLISVNDLKNIKEAYPNYFLDLKNFINFIRIALEKYKS